MAWIRRIERVSDEVECVAISSVSFDNIALSIYPDGVWLSVALSDRYGKHSAACATEGGKAAEQQVTINNFAYNPGSITIPRGDTVDSAA
jgi:hypothetical protein